MNGFRILYALTLAFGVGFCFSRSMAYEQETAEWGEAQEKHPGRITQVWITPLTLPLLVLLFPIVVALTRGLSFSQAFSRDFVWELLCFLSIYVVFLLMTLPLFRRIVSARACATLWLLPVYLYWLLNNLIRSAIPAKFVLRIPAFAMDGIFTVWMTGTILVMIWRVVGHLRFRKQILTCAYPVFQEPILTIWQEEQNFIERKTPISLLYSEYIRTPMTIGLSRRTIHTLLPCRDYTPEELRLIFRHELRHVQRSDVETKVFLVFLEAFCWFIPWVWLATRQATADLELSCDEMVLYGADEPTRKRYAELLLQTAGDDRGFSTCLSASARSLRSRLKSVMAAKRKFPGTVFLSVTTFFLALSCGLVTVTSEYGTMGDLVFPLGPGQKLESVQLDGQMLENWDEERLLAYLAELPVTKLGETKDDGYLQDTRRIQIVFDTNRSVAWLNLSEDRLEVVGRYPRGILTVEQYRLDKPLSITELLSQ